jgi:hypothetical protein
MCVKNPINSMEMNPTISTFLHQAEQMGGVLFEKAADEGRHQQSKNNFFAFLHKPFFEITSSRMAGYGHQKWIKCEQRKGLAKSS